MIRRQLVWLLTCGAIASGCIGNTNGAWKSADASVYFYDWSGDVFWSVDSIVLKHVALLLDEECRTMVVRDNRLVSTATEAPLQPTGQPTASMIPLHVTPAPRIVDEGFRYRHPDAGLRGEVKMSFDAGFYFEASERAVLRWQADYSDDVKHLATEGGEIWVERADTECR